MALSEVYNEDCIAGMKRYPDKYFDLAICDPPYGMAKNTYGSASKGIKANFDCHKKNHRKWDIKPTVEYIKELRRVSKHQIIWGANHFISIIPYDSSCWLVWDKDNTGDFSDCELAWTSFNMAVRKFKWRWNGMLQQNMKDKEIRIHPTQKPVALYDWTFSQYAKEGNLILDTHLGSQSSRIAADKAGLDFVGFELDNEYFDKGNKRFNEYKRQLVLDFA